MPKDAELCCSCMHVTQHEKGTPMDLTNQIIDYPTEAENFQSCLATSENGDVEFYSDEFDARQMVTHALYSGERDR